MIRTSRTGLAIIPSILRFEGCDRAERLAKAEPAYGIMGLEEHAKRIDEVVRFRKIVLTGFGEPLIMMRSQSDAR